MEIGFAEQVPDPKDDELSIREIVELLLNGKRITMLFNREDEFQQFNSNLQVEKSRKKHAHVDFGLDFENKIIRSIILNGHDKDLQVTFYCTGPTPPKKYSVFSITDSE